MNTQPASLHGAWLKIARLVWVTLILLGVVLAVIGLPEYSRQVLSLSRTGLDSVWTSDNLLQTLSALNLTPAFLLFFHLTLGVIRLGVFGSIGVLIFLRKSDTWLGLFVSYVLIGIGLTGFYSGVIGLTLIPMPWRFFVDLAATLVWPALFLLFILFPDGRFTPRWTRFLVPFLIIASSANEAATFFNNPYADAISTLLLPLVFISVASQIYRYVYVSGPVERQQTKWFTYAIVLFIGIGIIIQYLVFPTMLRFLGTGEQALLLNFAYEILFLLLFLTLPISIAFAIFRYRLWDIDVIIRKTLVYGVLSATLALVFFGGVTLLQNVFGALSGTEKSPAAIVLSTLAIYVLFNPLRNWVQDFIDRSFYRKKYNAAKTLARFAIMARDETDIDHLSAEIMAVVQETMQPVSVSIWLKPARGKRLAFAPRQQDSGNIVTDWVK